MFWPLSRVFAGSRETFTFGTTAFNRRVGKKAQTGSGNPFEQTRLIILLYLLFYDHYPQLRATRRIVELLNVSAKLAETCGELNKIGRERSIRPNLLELGKQPGRTILGEKIFHICYLIFPYLLSDLAGRAIKSVEFIFSAGFDGAILWSRGKKAEPDINL